MGTAGTAVRNPLQIFLLDMNFSENLNYRMGDSTLLRSLGKFLRKKMYSPMMSSGEACCKILSSISLAVSALNENKTFSLGRGRSFEDSPHSAASSFLFLFIFRISSKYPFPFRFGGIFLEGKSTAN